jgi:3-hydroxyisobutyrate dehydrogenase
MARLGFIGLGTMGVPIAAHLLRAGSPLLVWNRTPEKAATLAAAGAEVAGSAGEVLARCETVIFMLTDAPALDEVLGRGSPSFATSVRDRTIVNMATIPASLSAALAADVAACGGRFVEAPVSGSRRPAEMGQLIAMVAGDQPDTRRVHALIAPACREVIHCGPVPAGLLMKHATSLLLIPTFVALSEAGAFVRRAGLSPEAFARALLAGQMASDLLRARLPKLLSGDFSPHSSAANVLLGAEAALDAVHAAGSGDVVLEAARRLLARACDAGLGDRDVMVLSTLDP